MGLVGGNCSKDRHGVGRRNLEVVCEGKAWISSFSPIPGVYGNSDEASVLVFGLQTSEKDDVHDDLDTDIPCEDPTNCPVWLRSL